MNLLACHFLNRKPIVLPSDKAFCFQIIESFLCCLILDDLSHDLFFFFFAVYVCVFVCVCVCVPVVYLCILLHGLAGINARTSARASRLSTLLRTAFLCPQVCAVMRTRTRVRLFYVCVCGRARAHIRWWYARASTSYSRPNAAGDEAPHHVIHSASAINNIWAIMELCA